MSTCYKGVRYLLQYYDRGRDNGRGRDFDRRRDESPGKVNCPSVVMILYPYDNDTVPPSIINTVALYRKLQGKKSYPISPHKIPKPLIF